MRVSLVGDPRSRLPAGRGDGLDAGLGFTVDTIDTTGAGDSFNAGFLAAWLDGADLAGCLRWGAAAGALSTRRPGGVDG